MSAVVQYVSGNICINFTDHLVLNRAGMDAVFPQACKERSLTKYTLTEHIRSQA